MINNKLLNMSEEWRINISEKYKSIFNYEDFWYVNYDYIVFYKKKLELNIHLKKFIIY